MLFDRSYDELQKQLSESRAIVDSVILQDHNYYEDVKCEVWEEIKEEYSTLPLSSEPEIDRAQDTKVVNREESGRDVSILIQKDLAKEQLFECPICTESFSALELRKHAHSHPTLRKYLSVGQKNKVGSRVRFVARPSAVDNETIFRRPVKLHRCTVCQSEDLEASQLPRHFDSHRTGGHFKCDKCDRYFRKINHLNTHKVKHLKEYPYKCQQCGKGFVIRRNYDCHVLTHGKGENEWPYECKVCQRRFANPEHLNRHTLIHTENVTYHAKYKVQKCSRCLSTFTDRTEYQRHLCIKVSKKPSTYSCVKCNKKLNSASALYRHKRQIHGMYGEKSLCSVCGISVSNIHVHMLRHSGEKPYACGQCEKRFVAPRQLRQHLLVHTGVKPYVCSVCGKAFNNLYNLQVHERIHTGNRCHLCAVCGKGFLEKSYLKKHMNVHEK